MKEMDTSGWNFTMACPKICRGPLEKYNYNGKISSHAPYFIVGLEISALADTVRRRAAAARIKDDTRGVICSYEGRIWVNREDPGRWHAIFDAKDVGFISDVILSPS